MPVIHTKVERARIMKQFRALPGVHKFIESPLSSHMLSFLMHIALIILILLVMDIKRQTTSLKTQPVMVDVIIQKNKSHKVLNLKKLKDIRIASTKNQISGGHIAKEKQKITQPKGFTHKRHFNSSYHIRRKSKSKQVPKHKEYAAVEKSEPNVVLKHKKQTVRVLKKLKKKTVVIASIEHHSIFKSAEHHALNYMPKFMQEKPASKIGIENGKGAAKKEAVISIATKDIKYASYMAHIKQLVQSVWIYPDEALEKGQSGMLYLVFVINKNGALNSVKLIKTSGYSILDNAAINAIQEAAPFPYIPKRLNIDRLKIYASFRYSLSFDTTIY